MLGLKLNHVSKRGAWSLKWSTRYQELPVGLQKLCAKLIGNER